MLEISIADLMELEPRLAPMTPTSVPRYPSPGPLERPVSWAISVRSTPPHLPTMRGGEILFLSPRAIAAVGDELPALVREVGARGVVAVVVEAAAAPVERRDDLEHVLWLRWEGAINAAAETGVNRLLTEFRGDLYRIGSELERLISDAAIAAEGLEALLGDIAGVLGVPLRLHFADGQTITAGAAASDQWPMTDRGRADHVVARAVDGGARLEIGPAALAAAITARLLADRLARAVASALHREKAARPRGDRRIEALAGLLADGIAPADRRAAARALGLDPDGVFVVAVVAGGVDPDIDSLFAAVGEAHAAGTAGETERLLIAVHPRLGPGQLVTRIEEAKQRWRLNHPESRTTLALSGPAAGVERLPGAAREAATLAALQHRWTSLPPAASFAVVADVGVLGLLFHLREGGRLERYVADALGPLQTGDRRGTLRETLRTYLECGGSQVDAAARLGIHRNTLAYRLRRISELTGRDVTEPAAWLVLHLALLAADLLAVVPESPRASRTGD